MLPKGLLLTDFIRDPLLVVKGHFLNLLTEMSLISNGVLDLVYFFYVHDLTDVLKEAFNVYYHLTALLILNWIKNVFERQGRKWKRRIWLFIKWSLNCRIRVGQIVTKPVFYQDWFNISNLYWSFIHTGSGVGQGIRTGGLTGLGRETWPKQ